MRKLILVALIGFSFLLSACSSKAPILGVTDGKFKPCPDKSNCVNSQATDGRHKIASIIINAPKGQVRLAVMSALERIDGKVIEVKNNYIKAEFTSAVFGFVDDVELYFSDEENSSTIHVRSASRVGYSDLGVNRERIEEFRQIVESIVQ